MHVNGALFLIEVEAPDTGERITEPGRMGKMVITAFDRLAQPCIRFDSKNMLQLSPDKCECGRTFRLFPGGVIGKTDGITKVRGVLLAPSSVCGLIVQFHTFRRSLHGLNVMALHLHSFCARLAMYGRQVLKGTGKRS